MIKRFVSTIITAVALLPVIVDGADVRFRSGVIKSAEISSREVFVRNIRNNKALVLPERKSFAVVAVQLDKGRSLSIFDYSLVIGNQTFPAIAMRKNGRFEYFDNSVQGENILQLLFAVDTLSISGKTGEILLHCNLPPENNVYDIPVDFKNIGYRDFSKPQDFPEGK